MDTTDALIQRFRQRQIVSLHVGQAGVQTSTAIWSLLQKEHEINTNGVPLNGSNPNACTSFRETSDAFLKPR